MNVFSAAIGFAGYAYAMYVFVGVALFITELHSMVPANLLEYIPVSKIDGDGTAPADMNAAIVTNVLCLLLFAAQHSIMAREIVKKSVVKVLPASLERTNYVIAAAVTFHVMLKFWVPIPQVLFAFPASAANLVFGIHVIGLHIMFASTFMLDHFSLMGLRQSFGLTASIDSLSEDEQELQTFALYYYVRHPIMTGCFIAFWVFPTYSVGRVLLAVVLSLYIVLAVKYLEEPALKCLLGKQYEDYMETTPAYCPGFGASKKAKKVE